MKLIELEKHNSLSNHNTRIDIRLLENRFKTINEDIKSLSDQDLLKESIVLNIRKRFVVLSNDLNSLK